MRYISSSIASEGQYSKKIKVQFFSSIAPKNDVIEGQYSKRAILEGQYSKGNTRRLEHPTSSLLVKPNANLATILLFAYLLLLLKVKDMGKVSFTMIAVDCHFTMEIGYTMKSVVTA